MFRLPVSGIEVGLRAPNGIDDMLLLEAAGGPVVVGIALLGRLAHGTDDWSALTVTDFEVVLLRLREQHLGSTLTLGLACPACGARAEVSFEIAEYLAAIRPRPVAEVLPDPDRHGWFRLAEAGFRLPTACDQAHVAEWANPARCLATRCLDASAQRAPLRGRVLRAMAAMAPEVSRPIAGACPDCGVAVEAPLHVTRVVIAELRRETATVYDDVDLIARAYHWPEADILALPQERRRRYAERLRRAPALAA